MTKDEGKNENKHEAATTIRGASHFE